MLSSESGHQAIRLYLMYVSVFKPVHRSVLAESLAFYFALQQTFRNSGPLPPMIVEVCLCLSKHFIPRHVQ